MKEFTKHRYFGHDLEITRDNQAQEIQRRIRLGWIEYRRLKDTLNSENKKFKRKVLQFFGSETLSFTMNC